MKPMVVAVYYVVIPEIVQNKARRSLHIYGPGERTPHVPFATRLPRNYLYYVLHMAPELRRTRAARVLLRSEGSHRHVSVDAFVDALAAAKTGGWSAGREKRANFPKAPLSAVSHSFRLMLARAIIARSGLGGGAGTLPRPSGRRRLTWAPSS